MQIPEPQTGHLWLQQLIGEWQIETECRMSPDDPLMKMTGRERVRGLGKLWTIGEGTGDGSEDGGCESVMTLGFDPGTGRFTGTFIAAVMTHLWHYDGELDHNARILTLNSDGPSFSGDGTMEKYRDIIEIQDADHRTLTAEVQTADGQWRQFMVSRYRRVR